MDEQLRRQLKRLGVVKGLQKSQPSRSTPQPHPPSKRGALPGTLEETEHGPVWVERCCYSTSHVHGRYPLGELVQLPEAVPGLLGVPSLGEYPAFLDTETTGLSGGAGTLVFLVGVGVWQQDRLIVHQLFLRDPCDEAALLLHLSDILSDVTGLVSFNGRGFDVPLLENRFVLNRMAPVWDALPHLDLLTVARLLWRDHLPSRRLGVLEEQILDVRRTDVDLPSWMIPTLYQQYLSTGNASEMTRIFYHNLVDVLSLATLLVHAGRMVAAPDGLPLAAGEWAGVGRLYDRAGDENAAFAAWERALDGSCGDLADECAARLWQEMGLRYKRREVWDDALAIWSRWAELLPRDVDPLVERAKYYEWQVKDLESALAETVAALERAAKHPSGMRRIRTIEALRHRRARLERKIAKGSADGEEECDA